MQIILLEVERFVDKQQTFSLLSRSVVFEGRQDVNIHRYYAMLTFKDAPNPYSKHVPSTETKRWCPPQARSQ